MAKTAEFRIQINGIEESISAIEELNKRLDNLEAKINNLQNRQVNINASYTSQGGGGSTSNRASQLSEEEKLTRQILQLDEKRTVYQQQLYQSYLASKDLMKETLQDQKQIAASERLTADQYTNTMAGMKQQLADIKTVMQTVDLSDSGQFDKLTQKANELTNKLKEIEQSYGQFGRNVGNYANGVAEGLQKVNIQVGNTTREFANAREASRTLNNELKSMALNGQQNTDEYKNLNEAVKQLNSTLKDVEKSSVAMDNLLDTMEGFTAIASMSEGISSLFGIDNTVIEQSIQKLVALQNVLQSLEVIRKQMQTQEGVGKLLAKGSDAIDKMVASIVGVGTASKGATLAAKTLSTVLKSLGIGLAIAGIMEIIRYIERWSDKQKELAEEIEAEAAKTKKAIDDQRNAYVDAAAQFNNTASRLSYLRTEYQQTNDEMRKTSILKEASEEFKKLGINVKGVNDAQTMLVKNGGKIIELLRLQGDAAAIAALRMEAFKRSFNMLMENGYDARSASILAGYNKDVVELDKRLSDINPKLSKLKKELNVGVSDTKSTTNKISDNGKKVEKAVEQAQRKINELTISLMKDGLLKQLRQLDEQNRQEMNKIRQNGNRVKDLMKLQAQKYQQERQKIFDEYNKKINEANIDISFKIDETEIDRLQIVNDALKETSMLLPEIADSSEFFKDFSRLGVEISKLEGSVRINDLAKVDLPEALQFSEIFNLAKVKGDATEFHNFLMNYMKTLDADTQNELSASYNASLEKYRKQLGDEAKATEAANMDLTKEIDKEFRKRHSEQLIFIEKYGINLVKEVIDANGQGIENEQFLTKSIDQQQTLINNYYSTIGNTILENIRGIYSKRREAIEKEELKETSQITMSISDSLKKLTKDNTFDNFSKDIEQGVSHTLIALSQLQQALDNGEINKDTYTEQYRIIIDQEKKRLEGRLRTIKEYKPKIQKELDELEEKRKSGEVDEKTYEVERKRYNLIIDNIETFERQITETQQRFANQRNRLTQDEAKSNNEIISGWLNRIVNEYRKTISKINSLMDKSSNGGGFMNIKAIKSQLKEALNALRLFRSNIETQLSQLDTLYSQGALMPEEYTSGKSNLTGILSSVNETIGAVDDKLDEATKRQKEKINQQVQIWGQALVDVMGSIGDIQDSMLERQLEKLDEYNDKLEEKLQKQKDITQRYADDVKDIEDELETARGDRRQYLIDQLNEQMRAQRESLAQEQQIEKEQEKLEAKKKKLEDEANQRRKAQAITTALINAALAITNAAVNFWPQPAISMIAAATVTTAAQIAAIRAAKYEKGGLLKGKSHREGGIPVGNTGIEVEGKEYIIRKESTTPNIDLLNYINRSKRKLSLEDFIDFYGTKKMSSIIDSSKPRYASGGQLPTLRTDINTDTRMMQQMEQWNNRPVVVEVKEIINKAETLRKTQVLAGLNPKTL